MIEIVLATANPHKVEEMHAIFASIAPMVRLRGLVAPGQPPIPEIAETGATFEENSALKATGYARATGHLCLADDSGLEIDALNGYPGVISSHYSTDGREIGLSRADRDAANNQRVLRELSAVPLERRSARFVCVLTLAAPDGSILGCARGTFEGRIGLPGDVPRGSDGFGYDPLFLVPPDYSRASAELPPTEKNRLSHRRRAAEQMANILISLRGSAMPFS